MSLLELTFPNAEDEEELNLELDHVIQESSDSERSAWP